MIKRMVGLLALVLAALLGFGFGSGFLPRESRTRAKLISGIHPEREAPLTEYKSFAVVVYAQNDEDWCERSLRSIFAQDYDYFRLLLVDDGSSDQTAERVRNFIIENGQQDRVIVMHNETPCGFATSLARAVSHCLDREIVVPLFAKDWLASSSVLSHWNRAFQNPDVWIAFGQSIAYPSYTFRDPPKSVSAPCFYSAIFKQISVQYLKRDYLTSLLELAGGRVKNVWEPICFVNETGGVSSPIPTSSLKSLKPLQTFPKNWSNEPFGVDVVVFSQNQPLRLFAALEALERNGSGIGSISAMYWADERFKSAYEQLRALYPHVRFTERTSFQTAFETPAQYILFTTDDVLAKEPLDLSGAASCLARTGAHAFGFMSGKTPKAMPLSEGIFALEGAKAGLEMMLYPKSAVATYLKSARIQNLQDLSSAMGRYFPKDAVCLSFAEPKSVLLNVGREEELLSKFNQGFKIDLDSIFRGENPEFTLR